MKEPAPDDTTDDRSAEPGPVIRVAIVEDDAQLREVLAAFITRSAGFTCVASHGSAEDALKELPESSPDVVLMDIRLPGISGIECVARLRSLLPSARPLMLTAYEDSEEVFESLRAGAFGYILKSAEPARLLEAVREARDGGSPISGSVARKIVESFRHPVAAEGESTELTDRETEVLRSLAAGTPYKLIADELDISINTVRAHIKRIYAKLHVHNRLEALLEFEKMGKQWVRRKGKDHPGSAAVWVWLLFAALWGFASLPCHAEPEVASLQAVPFADVKLERGFWHERMELNREVTIPHVLQMCEKTGRIDNFAKAARRMEGSFRGLEYDDSDVFKAVESAAYSLAIHPDPAMEARLDRLIELIVAAQEGDGYLYTARTIHPDNPTRKAGSKRWLNECGDLIPFQDSHELYNLGHLIEAGIAHHLATGKRTLLDASIKVADLVAEVWGPGKVEIPPGHQEIELALVRLYDLTGDLRHLNLARFLLECRGRGKGHAIEFYANVLPVSKQTELVGHAVRTIYMCCAMTDIAARTDAPAYREAVETLWEDMISSKLSLTGGLGALRTAEVVGQAYDLPNAGAFNETCGALACTWWSHRMFLLTGESRYLDILERALFNGSLVAVSQTGNRYFYVNPLATDGLNPFNHGHCERFEWTSTACCPPNLTRMIAQVSGFAYAIRDRSLYASLYLDGTASIQLGADQIELRQTTDYPWSGDVRFEVLASPDSEWELNLRVPGWASGRPISSDLYSYLDPEPAALSLRVNGQDAGASAREGFLSLKRVWKKGDVVELGLAMPVRKVSAHEKITENNRRIALERGPIVYCIEGVDHEGQIGQFVLEPGGSVEAEHRPSLLGGVTVLHAEAKESFRAPDASLSTRAASITAIPYFAWCNRGATPMEVWLPSNIAAATPNPLPTLATRSRAICSHVFARDTVEALSDQVVPATSDDDTIPRFTWRDHVGSEEWVQYDFPKRSSVSAVEVFWFDEGDNGRCRVPESWSLSYFDGTTWHSVRPRSIPGTETDRFNRVEFEPILAVSLRLEVKLQSGFSSGILEWRVAE